MKISPFTIKSGRIERMLITQCRVSKAFDPKVTMQAPPAVQISALWDTGASNSMIDRTVAQKLGLIPTGIVQVSHANGISTVNRYVVSILLPNGLMLSSLTVTEGKLTGADMLIGMDIIGQGDFAITHKNNGTTFSFQTPSTHDIDFVEELKGC